MLYEIQLDFEVILSLCVNYHSLECQKCH